MDTTITAFSGILTAIIYLFYPVIRLMINEGKFPKEQAKKIALWNSVVLGAFFCILSASMSGNVTWNAGPALLYYWINKAILSEKKATPDETEEEDIEENTPDTDVTEDED